MSPDAAPDSRCPNCHALAGGRFCPHCGQKQVAGVPGVLEYLHELADQYVAIDGKVWRTLALLALRPGMLATEYIAGRRERYIGPLKLYLSISLVLFVLLSLLPAAGLHVTAVGQNDPAQDAQTAEQIRAQLNEQAPRAMFVLLPAFAGLTRLAFRRRPQRYATHLLLALHAHAMAFMLLIAEIALPFALPQSLVLLMPLWLLLALRRVFGGRWWALALRALLVSAIYAALLLGSTVAGVLLLVDARG